MSLWLIAPANLWANLRPAFIAAAGADLPPRNPRTGHNAPAASNKLWGREVPHPTEPTIAVAIVPNIEAPRLELILESVLATTGASLTLTDGAATAAFGFPVPATSIWHQSLREFYGPSTKPVLLPTIFPDRDTWNAHLDTVMAGLAASNSTLQFQFNAPIPNPRPGDARLLQFGTTDWPLSALSGLTIYPKSHAQEQGWPI